MNTLRQGNGTFSLSALNELVREAVVLSLPNTYWVEAEIASVNDSRGHCYMELVEKDEYSNTPVAQARACCWSNTWMRLSPRFQQVTGEHLRRGMKVLLLVKANFHPAFGFSWIVQNIDPTYTIGDMARRRQEILNQLKEEGVFDLNKSLPLSPFAYRIAVISSPTAAGYGDFCNQLSDNTFNLTFRTRLFPAIMQGEQVEESIINALEAIYAEIGSFDAVVIIRGGGSTADLSGFDTLALAENVANFPLPVITGIGHDRDQSVLDIIACHSVKTPTAAAEFLIGNLADTLAHINELSQRIVQVVVNSRHNEHLRMERLEHFFQSFYSIVKVRQESRLSDIERRLPMLISQKIERQHHLLDIYEQRCKALDPVRILRRGYSIMTDAEGKTVHDADTLKDGQSITVRLSKGTVSAVVKK